MMLEERFNVKLETIPSGFNIAEICMQEYRKLIQSGENFAEIGELAACYAHHPSFEGLNVDFRHGTLLRFGSLLAGYDDICTDLFEKDTKIHVPVSADDPERFEKRYAWLTEQKKEEWAADVLSALDRVRGSGVPYEAGIGKIRQEILSALADGRYAKLRHLLRSYVAASAEADRRRKDSI